VTDPVDPGVVIPLEELREPIQPKVPVPAWRWVVAALLAPVIFMLTLLPIGILCGQTFNDIPDQWAFVPIIGEFAVGLAVTIWALRGVVRPKPRKQRGFPVLRKNPDP
jgi:hypothetical protein